MPRATAPAAATQTLTASVAPTPGATSATPAMSPTPTSALTGPDWALVRDLNTFARDRSAESFALLRFGDDVGIGLGERIVVTRPAAELSAPSAWEIAPIVPFRARVGPFSALDLLKADLTTITIGPHPHCASAPVPAPAGLATHRRVSVQPAGMDTCVLWWTVDLFVNSSGRVDAVTIDFWDP